MASNDIYVLVPFSLDGAGAFLTLKWFLEPKDVNAKLIPINKENFATELNALSLTEFKKIYVVGGMFFENLEGVNGIKKSITLFKLESEKVDTPEVKVISLDSKNYTELVYNALKTKTNTDLDEQKRNLLTFIQDYVTYNLKYSQISIGINYIFNNFNNYQSNRLEKFCKKYENGFNGFDENDKKVIAHYNQKLEKTLQGDKYVGTITIMGEKVKIVSTFGEKCINEVASTILTSTGSDIACIVNPNTQTVTFRKNLKCKTDLKKLAKYLCDGDGKDYAAFGKITEKFLEFTKVLQKI